MSLVIYSYPNNYRVQKTLIAAQYNGVKIETPEFKFPDDLAKLKDKNPNAKVPTMDTPFGSLYESDAILRYVARLRPDTGLLGSTFFQQAQVDQWVNWSGFELEVARGAWLLPIYGVAPFYPEVTALAKEKVNTYLGIMDKHLLTRTYFVGNYITLADIVIATAVNELVRTVLTSDVLKKHENFTRWFTTVANQPQFKAVLGEPQFAQTEAQAGNAAPAAAGAKADKKEQKNDKPKKEEKPKGGDKPKKEEKPKGEKPKKDEKPKAEKPKKEEKPKAEKKDDADEKQTGAGGEELDDNGLPVVKKKPNPLDALPKSPMILDAVKKLFFQKKPFYPNFFNEFWKNEANPIVQWDPAGYSIYICKYKYNKDLGAQFFLAGNLVGGFLQRVDELRKYGMGALMLVGQTEDRPPWQCWGIWIFRGQDIPNEMKECDDSEHYDWIKQDTSKEATRKLVQDYFTADIVEGETVLDRRYFK